MISGQETGQILVNLDESEITQNDDTQEKSKAWNHLYSPNIELLFNQKVFPKEVLKGEKIGDYYIVKYGLFDETLKP